MIVFGPQIEFREAFDYVGKRAVVAMASLPQFIPRSIGEVAGWLAEHAPGAQAGPPFLRYWCIDMPVRLDVEVGVPVERPIAPPDGLTAGTLPAGRWAVLQYRNVSEGIEGNAHLLNWMALHGYAADASMSVKGECFAARVETFLTDPAAVPAPARWVTEVAILVKA